MQINFNFIVCVCVYIYIYLILYNVKNPWFFMSGKWQNQEVSNMLVTKWTCRENLRIHVSIVEAIEEIYCAMCPMKPYIECVEPQLGTE